LMTLYGTGVRRAELTRLQIPDIDSRRMVIHIRGGKGRQDRDVMISPTLLEALRDYWRGLKHKPTNWLFPGGKAHTAHHPITPKVVWNACQRAAQRAGLQNRVHPHTPLNGQFLARCDECGEEYDYEPKEILRVELELPASITPHELFK